MNAADRLRRFEAEGYTLSVAEVTPGEPALDCLRDAVLLQTISPLLHCIDAWIGEVLDWRPANDDGRVPGESTTLTLTARATAANLTPRCAEATPVEAEGQAISNESRMPQIGLCIDSQRLASLPQWPSELDEFVTTCWAERAVNVSLGDVELDAGDPDRAGQGGMLVLPSSFEPTMQVSLYCAESQAPLGIAWLDWRKEELVLNRPGIGASMSLQTQWTAPPAEPVDKTVETVLMSVADADGNAAEGVRATGSAADRVPQHRAFVRLGVLRLVPVRAWFAETRRQDPWTAPFRLCSTPVVVNIGSKSWHGKIVPLGNGLGVLMGGSVDDVHSWT